MHITGESPAESKKGFDLALNQLIDKYDGLRPNQLDPDQVFAIVHAYAYRTRLSLHHHRYLHGIRNLRRALPYIEWLLERSSDNDKYSMLAGLYHYMAASSYQRYPITRPILNLAPKGDLQTGHDLLVKASRSGHPLLQTEAWYFLIKIDLELAKKPQQALAGIDTLLKTYPENLIYQELHLIALHDSGQKGEANRQFLAMENLIRKSSSLSAVQKEHLLNQAKKEARRRN